MKQFLFALAGLGTIAVMPSAAIAQDTEGRHLGAARSFCAQHHQTLRGMVSLIASRQ